MKSFASDYLCKPHPEVVQAVAEACAVATDASYGEDIITKKAEECLKKHFGSHASVFFVSNGTAANRLALQAVLQRPYMAALSSEYAHINTAEAGASESLGHKIIPVASVDGKVKLEAMNPYVLWQDDIHLPYPEVLSISNATELGTVYGLAEIAEIHDYCWANDLTLHMDGARLANAAVALDESWLGSALFAETDHNRASAIVTLGATKNGGMMGDAVIFFNLNREEEAVVRRLQKQQGQLAARMNVVAAQFLALYSGDLWLKNASNANEMAALMAKRLQDTLELCPAYPVQSNALFVQLPSREVLEKLQSRTNFYVWDRERNIARFMCPWDTTEDDVEEFVQLVKEVMSLYVH